jgi:hypothetical protein
MYIRLPINMGGGIVRFVDYPGVLFRKLTGVSNVKSWASCEIDLRNKYEMN